MKNLRKIGIIIFAFFFAFMSILVVNESRKVEAATTNIEGNPITINGYSATCGITYNGTFYSSSVSVPMGTTPSYYPTCKINGTLYRAFDWGTMPGKDGKNPDFNTAGSYSQEIIVMELGKNSYGDYWTTTNSVTAAYYMYFSVYNPNDKQYTINDTWMYINGEAYGKENHGETVEVSVPAGGSVEITFAGVEDGLFDDFDQTCSNYCAFPSGTITVSVGSYRADLVDYHSDGMTVTTIYINIIEQEIVIFTVNGVEYEAGSTVKVVGNSATITAEDYTIRYCDGGNNNCGEGTSLTLNLGIWSVTVPSMSQGISLYVYLPVVYLGNEPYYFTPGETVTVPSGTDLKSISFPLVYPDEEYYSATLSVYNVDEDKDVDFSNYYFDYWGYTSYAGYVLSYPEYEIMVNWGIGTVYMGNHFLKITTVDAITGVISKATLNKGKITFTKSDNNPIRSAYSNGTVTYFIGKANNYSDLDDAFNKFGVTVSASEFFSSTLITPQGLVGDVELYTKISADGLTTLYPRSGKLNISNSGTKTTTFSLFIEEPIEQEFLKDTVVLTSDILKYNIVNNQYGNLLFIAIILISILLAVEVIIIKKNKNNKAHN